MLPAGAPARGSGAVRVERLRQQLQRRQLVALVCVCLLVARPLARRLAWAVQRVAASKGGSVRQNGINGSPPTSLSHSVELFHVHCVNLTMP